MRFVKRDQLYKGSNNRCSFNPIKMEAWSYSWWRFVEYIDGKVYFNGFHYSMPTGSHQRAVRKLLDEHGVKYVRVSYQAGLQNLSKEIENQQYRISTLEKEIATPRSQAKKNKARKFEIACIKAEILKIKHLIKKQGKGKFNPKKLHNFPPAPVKKEKKELVKVFSDNNDGTVMTRSQYGEERLQMSTGDFHTHKVIPFSRGAK